MSNDDDNYSIAARYRTVRKHLDVLGYRQALSLDSLPLIELLLVDLAQTKDTLKHFQTLAKENIQTCSQLQLAVDPYKCDNARLVQECNQAHLELLETKEALAKQSNEYKKQVRKLESEHSDLQLSFSKNLERIKQLETESSNKSKKISELLGKCCKPIVNNANLATKKRPCYPLRKPMIEADPLPKITTNFCTKNVEPYVVDFVSMADRRISSLTSEVTKLKEELFLSNENIQIFKGQLKAKDKELCRLRKLLEGGRPCTSVGRDHCSLRSKSQSTDNEEIECLRRDKLDLEQQLRDALNKQHEAMTQTIKLAERNEELERELKDVDRLAMAVEADCNTTVKENNKRVCRLQEKLDNLMTKVHVLQTELTIQRREAQELRADLESCRLEKSSIQRKLENTLEEKKQMTDRINSLTMLGSTDLICKIDELHKEVEHRKNKVHKLEKVKCNEKKEVKSSENCDKAQSKLVQKKGNDDCGDKLKEKQDKCDVQKKSTKKLSLASKSSHKSVDQEQISKQRKCCCHIDTEENEMHSNIDKFAHDKNVIIESLQNTIEKLESERDHYKCEYVKIKDQFKKDFEKDSENLWSQICELREQMSEKEHAISKLLREKKDLCREKFDLENKLHIQQATPSTHHCPYRTSPLSERKSVGLSSKVERLEREKDSLRADIERLIAERDSLRERLQLGTEAHVSEQRMLRDRLDEVQLRLARTERERRELLIAQEGRRAALSGLDDQLDDVREELRRTKQELSEQRTQYFQLRALQDQTDQALGDVQSQLTECESELTAAMDRNKSLERQQLQLDNQIKELRQEISSNRNRMAQMERDKDQLLMDLDEKTEKIAALEREIDFKEQQASNMEQQIRDLSHTKQICSDQVTDIDRQMRTMQLDIENLQRQLTSANIDRENAIQENRRLQDDLAAASCDVRKLHKDLEASKAEAHDLKRQLQTYVTEVRRAEELLSQKDNERTEMLNHFRSLSLEASVLENNNHSLESEAAEARGALQSARDQMADLEQQMSNKDCLIRGYEAQITELTQNVASLEIQLQQATDQRNRAEEDLRTVRDLCVTLEQQKECISHRLEENIELKTQYELQVDRYRSEQEIFQDQLNKDHKTIDRLERLLEEARKETMMSQANARDLQSEVSKLRQKVCDLQTKLTSETAEVRKYQNQASEFSKQITELRRQITNERYEKSRLREETRRTHEVRRVQDDHLRCDKEMVPTKKKKQLRWVCSVCDCTGGNIENQTSECCIPEDSAIVLDDDNCNDSHAGNFQEISNRVCLCTGRVDDDVVESKMIKDRENNCRNCISEVVKKYCEHCPHCNEGIVGSRQKRNNSESFLWLVETLLLVNKFLNEKKKRSKDVCEVPEYDKVIAKIPEVNDGDDVQDKKVATKLTVTKYSNDDIQSIRSSSTQTIDDSCQVADSSQPHLLKILAEIQQYAKSIEDYFHQVNESLRQQQQSLHEGLIQVGPKQRLSPRSSLSPRPSLSPRRNAVAFVPVNDRTQVKERLSSEPSKVNKSAEADNLESSGIHNWDKVPYTSTPHRRARSRLSNEYQDLEDARMIDGDLCPARSPSESSDLDLTEYMSLPGRRRIMLEPEIEPDDGEYMDIPEQYMSRETMEGFEEIPDEEEVIGNNENQRSNGHSNGNSNNNTNGNGNWSSNRPGHGNHGISGIATLNSTAAEQIDDVYTDMEAIKRKIENLRSEILRDFERDREEPEK